MSGNLKIIMLNSFHTKSQINNNNNNKMENKKNMHK